jgi:hypothetical protein
MTLALKANRHANSASTPTMEPTSEKTFVGGQGGTGISVRKLQTGRCQEDGHHHLKTRTKLVGGCKRPEKTYVLPNSYWTLACSATRFSLRSR